MMLSAVNTFEVFHEAVSLLDIYSRLGFLTVISYMAINTIVFLVIKLPTGLRILASGLDAVEHDPLTAYTGLSIHTDIHSAIDAAFEPLSEAPASKSVTARATIEAAMKVLFTGYICDGKIFVYDVENVVKVRTGEEGCDALQDVE